MSITILTVKYKKESRGQYIVRTNDKPLNHVPSASTPLHTNVIQLTVMWSLRVLQEVTYTYDYVYIYFAQY